MAGAKSEQKMLTLWAEDRRDYVSVLRTTTLQVRSPKRFGWKSAPYFGLNTRTGQLFTVDVDTFFKLRPTVLEISDVTCPIAELVDYFVRPTTPTNEIIDFLSRLLFLGVNESGVSVEDLCKLIDAATNLTSFAICESAMQNVDDRRRVFQSLSSKQQLKAIDFGCAFTGEELNDHFHQFRHCVRIVRLSGSTGMKLEEFRKINVALASAEFVALQEMDVDLETTQGNWQREVLNRCVHMFPTVKFFYLDYKVFDTVFIFDDASCKRTLEAIRDFFKRLKLVLLSVLIYCPDSDSKSSVDKAAKYFAEDCDIRTGTKYFFRGAVEQESDAETPPNFALMVLGDQVHVRTKRLVQVVVNEKNSTPDLRHFCYIVEMDSFSYTDSTVAFGGFNGAEVQRMFREKVDPDVEFVPDTVLNNHLRNVA